jgi:hypothetical protein
MEGFLIANQTTTMSTTMQCGPAVEASGKKLLWTFLISHPYFLCTSLKGKCALEPF